jgi:hypothetical protein
MLEFIGELLRPNIMKLTSIAKNFINIESYEKQSQLIIIENKSKDKFKK